MLNKWVRAARIFTQKEAGCCEWCYLHLEEEGAGELFVASIHSPDFLDVGVALKMKLMVQPKNLLVFLGRSSAFKLFLKVNY